MPILRTGRTARQGSNFRFSTPSLADAAQAVYGQGAVNGNWGIVETTTLPTGDYYALGIGNTFTITPVYNSNLYISFSGLWVSPTGVGNSCTLYILSGTGTPPNNGDIVASPETHGYIQALTDTSVGTCVSCFGYIQALAAGTTYWIDIALTADASPLPVGPIGVNKAMLVAFEF